LFGANFIIAFIFILFILYLICTAPIKSAPGGSTAPRSGEDSICFCPRPHKMLTGVACCFAMSGAAIR